ncbi:MAG: roadblock/LC7 domain-containing protein [Desulfobulbaceae bacterium]|nr:roadblock/LC7 domain-containing protein [Desulfobulbaceae bacterium]
MAYKEFLKSLTEGVDGGLAALIMGYDGIPIDEWLDQSTNFDLQLLSVEYSNLLRDIRHTVELLENGAMEEVTIATDRLKVLIRVINPEFFLVLVMTADGNYGKGRYLLSRESFRLKSELE